MASIIVIPSGIYLVPPIPGGICFPLTALNPFPFLFLTRSPGLSKSTEIGSILISRYSLTYLTYEKDTENLSISLVS